MRSFHLFLLSAAAFLLTGCATVPIREQSPHHAVVRPANVPALTITNYATETGRAFNVSGGFIADSITFADEPYQITFGSRFLGGANSVILKVQLFSGGHFVCDATASFTLDRQYAWDLYRPGYQGGYECGAKITEGELLDSRYGILGGLIRVDRNGGSSRGGTVRGRPAWGNPGPAWEK